MTNTFQKKLTLLPGTEKTVEIERLPEDRILKKYRFQFQGNAEISAQIMINYRVPLEELIFEDENLNVEKILKKGDNISILYNHPGTEPEILFLRIEYETIPEPKKEWWEM